MRASAASGKPGHTIAMPSSSSPRATRDVLVSHASVADLISRPNVFERARAIVDARDAARFSRFHREIDGQMFLLGRLMARTLVGRALGCDPQSWTWREGPRGRPEVGHPPTALRFNLAHSAGLVLCAIARGREVGVDVEDTSRRTPDPGIVDRYCAPAEVADIGARGDAWPERFLEYWTLKEAYLKARGLGIAVPLSEISFTLDGHGSARIGFLGTLSGTDERWSFTLARPSARHLAAVAVSTADGARPIVTFQAFALDES